MREDRGSRPVAGCFIGEAVGAAQDHFVMIPFEREIDAVFRGRWPMPLKMVVGAIAGALIVLGHLAFSPPDIGARAQFGFISCGAGAGADIVPFLSFRDAVQRRIDRGDPVHRLLHLYLCNGTWSILLGMLTVILLTLVMTIVAASLNLRPVGGP